MKTQAYTRNEHWNKETTEEFTVWSTAHDVSSYIVLYKQCMGRASRQRRRRHDYTVRHI
jgi:hypothetical protein